MKIIKLFFVLLTFIAIASCENDNNIAVNEINNPNTPTTFSQNFGLEITRSFLGNVIDSNENPIENVTISIGSEVATTDSNGVFIINNALVYERFAYIKAEKTGYIHGSRSVVPSSGTNKVTIMLLEETVAGTTNSGTVETISLTNGASVSLNGEYVDEDGTEYTGSVNVIMHHLDPVDDKMPMQMPGMLYAENTEGEERMLQTLGMLAVELRGTNGEDLNLAEGSTAEIKIPVDASLLADAPTTIPLWYFDETNGYWIEEGEANLVGSEYIGTVAHFSFWNCDIPAEAVNICVTVVDENGNTIANSQVNITSSVYGTRSGYTNENGEVCGLIPSNETLDINVYEYSICGNNSIYTASIGPYTSDSSLSITIPSSTNIISETIIGLFNDCNDTAVSNGYILLTYGGQQFYDTVTDGTFEINLIHCTSPNTFSIEGFDYDNVQTTGAINYTFSTPITDLGTLTSCDSVDEFVTYQIDDHPTIAYNFNIYSGFDGLNYLGVTVSDNGQNPLFYLDIYDDTAITTQNYVTSLDEASITVLGDINGDSLSDNVSTNQNITISISAIGNVGEYLDVNFSGDYDDLSGNNHTITGVIHVLRDN